MPQDGGRSEAVHRRLRRETADRHGRIAEADDGLDRRAGSVKFLNVAEHVEDGKNEDSWVVSVGLAVGNNVVAPERERRGQVRCIRRLPVVGCPETNEPQLPLVLLLRPLPQSGLPGENQ